MLLAMPVFQLGRRAVNELGFVCLEEVLKQAHHVFKTRIASLAIVIIIVVRAIVRSMAYALAD